MGRSSSATTGPTCAEAALDVALGLAKELGDAIVVVFGYAPPGIWGGEIAEHEEAIEELGEKVIGKAKEQARREGVEAEIELVTENGRRRRCSRSPTSASARMIVVGSYGERAAERGDPRLDPAQAAAHSRRAVPGGK